MHTSSIERIFVDPLEASRLMGVSRSYLYQHFLNTGALKFIKRGRRTLIAVDDIRALAEAAA